MRVEEMRHAVYLAGAGLVVERRGLPGGAGLTVVMVDAFAFSVGELADLAEAVIGGQVSFMGDTAFPPFVVTAIPVGEPLEPGAKRNAGTGLYRSFALFLPPKASLTESTEFLLAHELFHYWNGWILRRVEPEELLYWFSEGFTDYYAGRLLHESGRWDGATYVDWLNRQLRRYVSNPAVNASNEEIRAGYWKLPDTVGEVPYQRGLCLALRWHSVARSRGVVDGVDGWFKSLVERGRGGFRASNAALREAGVRRLGRWFDAEFERYVMAARTVEVPADALGSAFVGERRTVYDFALGFDQERSKAAKRVCGLVSGSAAERAGLREGDELAGWSIHRDADVEAKVRVQRGEEVVTIRYYPRGAAREVVQFAVRGGG
jgi:predicted metalloprotease with PDZ domain